MTFDVVLLLGTVSLFFVEEFSLDNSILNALPDPIVLINEVRAVVDFNHAAKEVLADLQSQQDLSVALQHREILDVVDHVLKGGAHDGLEVTLPHPVPRTFELSVTRVSEASAPREAAKLLLVLHDVTATKAAESFRSDFIANVSHELRSPLVSLIGFIETLQTSAQDDPEARERFLAIMAAEANRMKSLIGDLLSLSQIEANEHIRPRGSVDITRVVQMVIEPLRPKAEQRSIDVVCECSAKLPSVFGDQDELIQLFNNLVDNAIKYGRESAPVAVSVERVERIPDVGGAGVVVRVRNFGDPIPPEDLPRLTERFYRIDKGRSRSVGGTGLGLAIVKHMVNRHRGRLVIESDEVNGTVFSVYLPLAE